ncbi:uncharacterized protein LOC123523533 [Mercenaria mercenaria]|uniref:uncharacterized protein LOC123523533 n=1 Tax=Mercenaria mercenaria TaxID=6596 RepID=UPI00234EA2F9|nr:uncharacterized protein LOC123523533 [Mercenaria mercenaria]
MAGNTCNVKTVMSGFIQSVSVSPMNQRLSFVAAVRMWRNLKSNKINKTNKRKGMKTKRLKKCLWSRYKDIFISKSVDDIIRKCFKNARVTSRNLPLRHTVLS